MDDLWTHSWGKAPEVMAKVKDEKVYRAESRVGLKGIKYGTAKNTIEDMAFGDGGVSGSI